MERLELFWDVVSFVEREIGTDRLVIRLCTVTLHVGDGGETLTGH